jgi:hypothetical protein
MNITLTSESVYLFCVVLLIGIQIYHHRRIENLKTEQTKLWDQIATFNTMVAMKLLENQKEINKLNEQNNINGK